LGDPPRYYRTAAFAPADRAYTWRFTLPEAGVRPVLFNFPLYQGVAAVEVGVNEGARVLPPAPFADPRPIVVYGTSITQGGCANRPGMAYTNLLSRWLNREVVNLGFSGNGWGDEALARCMAEIADPACFVLDYEANAHLERLKETLIPFIGALRAAHPAVPILVVTKIRFSYELAHADALEGREACKAFQQDTVAALRAQGDTHLHFLDGSTFLGEDWEECTVDGVHPTDLGFWRIAQGMAPVLRRLLG
ncbi:MAG TPA: SGNH/GDSL hydrolase family protein, partial [Armatimonadota bacterium]|nr:SGNH/GDSL hydrolase family protein [Armatimonadota bacterium]